MSNKVKNNKGTVQSFGNITGNTIDTVGSKIVNSGISLDIICENDSSRELKNKQDRKQSTTREKKPVTHYPNTFHINVSSYQNNTCLIKAKYYQDQQELSAREDKAQTKTIHHLLNELSIEDHASVKYGDILGAWIFAGAIRDLFLKAMESSPYLNIVLQIEVSELRHLIWESLRGPVLSSSKQDFLALNQSVSFSQMIGTSKKAQPLLNPRQVKVLSFIANPPDSNSFNLPRFNEQEVINSIEQGIRPKPLDIIHYAPEHTSYYPDLSHLFALLDRDSPTILHLVAHGAYKTRGYILYLLNEHGQVRPYPIELVIKQLQRLRKPPQFVFLAVCNSGQSSIQAPSLAHQLVQELGCSFVLGMTNLAFVEDANLITKAFYQRLWTTGCPNQALSYACGYLSQDQHRLVPALYTRKLNDRLITTQ